MDNIINIWKYINKAIEQHHDVNDAYFVFTKDEIINENFDSLVDKIIDYVWKHCNNGRNELTNFGVCLMNCNIIITLKAVKMATLDGYKPSDKIKKLAKDRYFKL